MIPVNERSPVWPYFEYQGSVWVVGCSSVGLGVWARMRGEMARRDKREERSFVVIMIVKSCRLLVRQETTTECCRTNLSVQGLLQTARYLFRPHVSCGTFCCSCYICFRRGTFIPDKLNTHTLPLLKKSLPVIMTKRFNLGYTRKLGLRSFFNQPFNDDDDHTLSSS